MDVSVDGSLKCLEGIHPRHPHPLLACYDFSRVESTGLSPMCGHCRGGAPPHYMTNWRGGLPMFCVERTTWAALCWHTHNDVTRRAFRKAKPATEAWKCSSNLHLTMLTLSRSDCRLWRRVTVRFPIQPALEEPLWTYNHGVSDSDLGRHLG